MSGPQPLAAGPAMVNRVKTHEIQCCCRKTSACCRFPVQSRRWPIDGSRKMNRLRSRLTPTWGLSSATSVVIPWGSNPPPLTQPQRPVLEHQGQGARAGVLGLDDGDFHHIGFAVEVGDGDIAAELQVIAQDDVGHGAADRCAALLLQFVIPIKYEPAV